MTGVASSMTNLISNPLQHADNCWTTKTTLLLQFPSLSSSDSSDWSHEFSCENEKPEAKKRMLCKSASKSGFEDEKPQATVRRSCLHNTLVYAS